MKPGGVQKFCQNLRNSILNYSVFKAAAAAAATTTITVVIDEIIITTIMNASAAIKL